MSPNVTPPVTCQARKQQLVLLHLAVSTGSLSFLGWHGGVQQVRQTAPVASNALVMPAGFHSSVGDPGNRRSPLAPELVEGRLEEVGRCDVLQPCPVEALRADGAVLVEPDSVLEVAAEGEPRTWPRWGRLKRCLHLLLLLSRLEMLLLLLLWAAGLLGRSILMRRDTRLPAPPSVSQKEDQMSFSTLLLPSKRSPENIPRPYPVCAQWCIFSIVRANFEKYDLCSAHIAHAPPRYIVPFFNT